MIEDLEKIIGFKINIPEESVDNLVSLLSLPADVIKKKILLNLNTNRETGLVDYVPKEEIINLPNYQSL
jgi:hypothetical protein